jgi:hypothetical protein
MDLKMKCDECKRPFEEGQEFELYGQLFYANGAHFTGCPCHLIFIRIL